MTSARRPPGPDDEPRDPRLVTALQHAPDADEGAPHWLSQRILEAASASAHDAASTASERQRRHRPPRPAAAGWGERLARGWPRGPWPAAAFASLLALVVVGGLMREPTWRDAATAEAPPAGAPSGPRASSTTAALPAPASPSAVVARPVPQAPAADEMRAAAEITSAAPPPAAAPASLPALTGRQPLGEVLRPRTSAPSSALAANRSASPAAEPARNAAPARPDLREPATDEAQQRWREAVESAVAADDPRGWSRVETPAPATARTGAAVPALSGDARPDTAADVAAAAAPDRHREAAPPRTIAPSALPAVIWQVGSDRYRLDGTTLERSDAQGRRATAQLSPDRAASLRQLALALALPTVPPPPSVTPGR